MPKKKKIKVVQEEEKSKKKASSKKETEIQEKERIVEKNVSGMDKVLKMTSIFAILLVSISFFYYVVLFRPQIEKAAIEKEPVNEEKTEELIEESKETIEKESNNLGLVSCINLAKEAYFEVFETAIESCDQYADSEKKSECVNSLREDIQKGLGEAKEECYRKYGEK